MRTTRAQRERVRLERTRSARRAVLVAVATVVYALAWSVYFLGSLVAIGAIKLIRTLEDRDVIIWQVYELREVEYRRPPPKEQPLLPSTVVDDSRARALAEMNTGSTTVGRRSGAKL